MNFKNYLNEYIKSDSSKKEWEMMLAGYLPLRPNFFENIPVENVFHVTNKKGFANLVKYQNQKKQIATFSKGSERLSRGLIANAEILVQLKGKTVLTSNIDLYTQLSRNGYRWLRAPDHPYISKHFSEKMFPKMIEFMKSNDEFLNFVKEDNKTARTPYEFPKPSSSFLGMYIYSFVENDASGKFKRDFIQFYMDEAKKLITPTFIKELREVLLDENDENDEIVLHDFTIIGVWKIMDETSRFYDADYFDSFDTLIKKYKIKYCGEIQRSKIAKINTKKNSMPKCKD